jgi:hypothetical protein
MPIYDVLFHLRGTMVMSSKICRVILFLEAALPLGVIQPRLVEAIDKAIDHGDAPCMISVVSVVPYCDAFHQYYLN